MDFVGDVVSAPLICLGWLIVGAIAGALARAIMRSGNEPLISDIILGIAGAFVGGIIAGILGMDPTADTSGLSEVLVNLVVATIGAMVLIGIWRVIRR
jgi:uncharacterized membrane protein YeaQ/YmgE (transglycosylase-associated protein family)